MPEAIILKADGTQEPFVPEKLLASLTKAGATPTLAESIVEQIVHDLKPLTKTADIYRSAFALLEQDVPRGTAARYALKRAIFDFGPSGFPFEAYVAELFRKRGFDATTNAIARGKCVEHEIDVLLKKDGITTYVEAKFHNTPGFKTDLKVVLYVQARIEDIKAKEGESVHGMVLTNTKFTSMARQYASCAGLPLMGWDYPQGEDLHALIGESGLYPITALSTLTRREKEQLLSQKIVLCRDLPHQTEALRNMGLTKGKMSKLFTEVGALCGTSVPV